MTRMPEQNGTFLKGTRVAGFIGICLINPLSLSSCAQAPDAVPRTIEYAGQIGDMRSSGIRGAIRTVIASEFSLDLKTVDAAYTGIDESSLSLSSQLHGERQRNNMRTEATQAIDVVLFKLEITDARNPAKGGTVSIKPCTKPSTEDIPPDCSMNAIPSNNPSQIPKPFNTLKSYQIFAKEYGDTRVVTINSLK